LIRDSNLVGLVLSELGIELMVAMA